MTSLSTSTPSQSKMIRSKRGAGSRLAFTVTDNGLPANRLAGRIFDDRSRRNPRKTLDPARLRGDINTRFLSEAVFPMGVEFQPRDYRLAGPENARAVERGLATATWYSC